MKLETFLQILEPGHPVRLSTGQELESAGTAGYEWLIPEDLLERKVTAVHCFIEPDDPGIRLMTEAEIGETTGDRSCFLEDLLQVLDAEEEAMIHIVRGQEKLGHAGSGRIASLLSSSVLESTVEQIAPALDREWDLVLTVKIR